MVSLPEFQSYGKHTSLNYGVNCIQIIFGAITVWYSYTTPVAFQVGGANKVVRQNDWSVTTGKHLNRIEPNKKVRVSAEVFDKEWQKQIIPMLKKMGRAA
jgi:hypothetical protein